MPIQAAFDSKDFNSMQIIMRIVDESRILKEYTMWGLITNHYKSRW